MKESEVLKCQIQEWFPRFRGVSFPTNIHILPQSFVAFLLQDGDGLFLSRASAAMPRRIKPSFPQLQAEDYHRWSEEDDEHDEPAVPSFPELERQIDASIQQLGGYVFPKLNWSAPVDSSWISASKTLKCETFAEISLLLKASDTITHDLCHAFDACEDKVSDRPRDFVLALRKWYDLRPEMEFRVFVRGGFLVGVCQREVTSFYPSLSGREEYIGLRIKSFFSDNLLGQFELEDYCFDCYVTKNGKVKLMDFNPWGGSTLPLLFTWAELEERHSALLKKFEADLDEKCLTQGEPDFGVLSRCACGVEVRFVKSEGLVQPSFRATCGVPIDLVEKGPGSAWDEFLRNLQQDVKQQSQEADCCGN